jgi:hypothetical protein
MTDLTNWDYYYNLEGTEHVRANLVYTPYVSPDKKTLCMSFNRDLDYHKYDYENIRWNAEILKERFDKELEFHSIASKVMPTLKLQDVDMDNRKIFLEWHGNDFLMQGMTNGYDSVLPDWQAQWIDRIETMWANDIYKISLHPNSWVAHDGELIPFNWFFCYHENNAPITIRSLLLQISTGRQEKLVGIDIDAELTPKQLQTIAFHSFKNNYPTELIENVLSKVR